MQPTTCSTRGRDCCQAIRPEPDCSVREIANNSVSTLCSYLLQLGVFSTHTSACIAQLCFEILYRRDLSPRLQNRLELVFGLACDHVTRQRCVRVARQVHHITDARYSEASIPSLEQFFQPTNGCRNTLSAVRNDLPMVELSYETVVTLPNRRQVANVRWIEATGLEQANSKRRPFQKKITSSFSYLHQRFKCLACGRCRLICNLKL